MIRHYLSIFAFLVYCAHAWCVEPVLEVIADEKTAHPGEPIRIQYEVVWHGGASDYAVAPPEFGEVDWADVRLGSTSASQDGDRNRIVHSLEFVASETGSYETPEVVIGYRRLPQKPRPDDASEAEARADEYMTLRAAPIAIAVRPDRTVVYVGGGVVGALVLCLSAWAFLRSRRTVSGESAVPLGSRVDYEAAETLLNRAKRARVDGDYYNFYLGLGRVLDKLGDSANVVEAKRRLDVRAQEVGYQGVKPTEDDMDSSLRDVERVLASERQKV